MLAIATAAVGAERAPVEVFGSYELETDHVNLSPQT